MEGTPPYAPIAHKKMPKNLTPFGAGVTVYDDNVSLMSRDLGMPGSDHSQLMRKPTRAIDWQRTRKGKQVRTWSERIAMPMT